MLGNNCQTATNQTWECPPACIRCDSVCVTVSHMSCWGYIIILTIQTMSSPCFPTWTKCITSTYSWEDHLTISKMSWILLCKVALVFSPSTSANLFILSCAGFLPGLSERMSEWPLTWRHEDCRWIRLSSSVGICIKGKKWWRQTERGCERFLELVFPSLKASALYFSPLSRTTQSIKYKPGFGAKSTHKSSERMK